MDTTEPQQRTTGILEPALRCLQARAFDPVTKFVNQKTSAVVVTRDSAVYRLFGEWQEMPFDRSPR